eukprot:COSAG05_NODE_13950_length_413_cov_0.729299_1_plen_29_part_01
MDVVLDVLVVALLVGWIAGTSPAARSAGG